MMRHPWDIVRPDLECCLQTEKTIPNQKKVRHNILQLILWLWYDSLQICAHDKDVIINSRRKGMQIIRSGLGNSDKKPRTASAIFQRLNRKGSFQTYFFFWL